MIEVLDIAFESISGLYTLPWILVGFIATNILVKIFGEITLNNIMKKIGMIILYLFVPLLLFRIFLGVDFQQDEIAFTAICFILFSFMYLLAYIYAKSQITKQQISGKNISIFLKTLLTNQGRSSAFIGGAMLAIPQWSIYAALYMSIGAIFLFAVIPYTLLHLHKKDIKKEKASIKIDALPGYLKIYPWYLLTFAIAAITLHSVTGITIQNLGTNGSILFRFFTQLTIPIALYYVGAGIHPKDLKYDELKKIFLTNQNNKDHWLWIQKILFLTVILTPLLTIFIFLIPLTFGLIHQTWFSVIIINSILPITSTNMFLIPYGIDKKVTAHAVTWTTLICTPIVVGLIIFLSVYFI
jgi:hypothetical protein